MLDDAVVEAVAGDADAGMGERDRLEPPRRAGLEAHHREVAGAAAEIGDQHGLRPLQVAGIPIGGAERLKGEIDLRHAGAGIGGPQPAERQLLVRPLAGEDDRAARDQRRPGQIVEAGR